LQGHLRRRLTEVVGPQGIDELRMKKTTDTSILENIAEDKISFELQKYDLLVAKPKSDRSGTDLLVFAEIADSVKFCRIQSKGRSLEYSTKSYIEIPKDYVTDGFLVFLYIYFSFNSEELYVFLPTDIRQWRINNRSGSANLNKPLSGKSATNNALKWA
jgi:hypothetical protein